MKKANMTRTGAVALAVVATLLSAACAPTNVRTATAEKQPWGCEDPSPNPGTECSYHRNKHGFMFSSGSSQSSLSGYYPQPGTPEAYWWYKHGKRVASAVSSSQSAGSEAAAAGPTGYYPQPGTAEAYWWYKHGKRIE